MNRFSRSFFWAACAVLTVLSLLPVEKLPPVFDWWDKAQHTLAFLAISALGLWAYSSKPARVIFGLLFFGIGIELAQAATGWRFGDWQDWLADSVGVGVAYFGWVFLYPVRSHGHSSTP
jgi:hypothetical protein